MVCDHDHALGERTLDSSIRCNAELTSHRRIPAYPYQTGSPPVGDGGCEQAKRLLRQGHVGIVEVAVEPVQRRSEKLGKMDTAKGQILPGNHGNGPDGVSYMAALPKKYIENDRARRYTIIWLYFSLPEGCSMSTFSGIAVVMPAAKFGAGTSLAVGR